MDPPAAPGTSWWRPRPLQGHLPGAGLPPRDIPRLILEKNLFGLDIDERAAQLAGFALMMKARADDRRLFERGVKLNVMALVDSAGSMRRGWRRA